MTKIVLPNVRKNFIPDPGMTWFDVDLAGADAQVVAWEAEDEDLMAAFKAGLDVHDKNAEDLLGAEYTSLAGTAEEGPKSRKRKQFKQNVHLTNYGGSPKAIAMINGWTIHESERFQKRWFELHPGIKQNFQRRVELDLRSTRTVRNKFGFHRVYFDRPEASYTEALAWIPQSTVALVTYRGALKLEAEFSYVQMLLQVHDSLCFQVPHCHEGRVQQFRAALENPILYPDPLTIPWGFSKSRVSWGDCQKVAA